MNGVDGAITVDREIGELRILGHRHVAIDAEALCAHLNQLVGPGVAEVIIRQHEYRLGKEETDYVRKENPKANLRDIIRVLEESERVSGVGIVNVVLPAETTLLKPPFQIEITNPCVKDVAGAAKSIISSYWSGVFSCLLGAECEAEGLRYKESENILRFTIVLRR